MHSDWDFGLEDLVKGLKKMKGRGSLRPCAQLRKTRCGRNNYNFAYVRWGVVVRTMTNTVWVFNGRDVHGTVMPSQDIQQQAESMLYPCRERRKERRRRGRFRMKDVRAGRTEGRRTELDGG
ncbi:hypothetical protein K438DRAFT_1874743 [Mycena galopus ATCC 62051]|nr:hypothetical protein K438DRAFT_1874743 [Mycena galopus ATCC 62051]